MSGQRFSDIIRVRLDLPLPCGMKDCAERTTYALVEPNPAIAGLWQLLPVCESCQSAWSEPNAVKRRLTRRAGRSSIIPLNGR